MLVGTSQINITPPPGTELCGFANRPQPSDHILDPLYARVLCLEEKGVKIFLINLDLIGVEGSFVQRIRSELKINLDIPESHIQIFATHTHSGPGTIHLNFCGEYNPDYVDGLSGKILGACTEAFGNMEPCMPEYHERELQLGINRRNEDKSALPLKTLAFKKADGIFKAVLVSYPMHPVCLKGTGISADYPGIICGQLKKELAGDPLVLFGLGAAGDIDPPGVGVNVEQMGEWGSTITRIAIDLIQGRLVDRENGRLGDRGKLDFGKDVRMGPACTINIRLKTMEPKEIDEYAEKYLLDSRWKREFGSVFPGAVGKWRGEMKDFASKGLLDKKVIEVGVLEIGALKLVFVNAELFSEFERILKNGIDTPFMIISCSNGLEGYLFAQEEYEKGGYEIETALFFYNSFSPEPGSLEMIADETIKLLKNLTT